MTAERTEIDRTAVDEALARLDGLSERPVEEHVTEYDAIHAVLREALSSASRGDRAT